jgi:putative heme iron utilization protein
MSAGNATAMIASLDATPPKTNTEDNEIYISHTWRHALALKIEKEQGVRNLVILGLDILTPV